MKLIQSRSLLKIRIYNFSIIQQLSPNKISYQLSRQKEIIRKPLTKQTHQYEPKSTMIVRNP